MNVKKVLILLCLQFALTLGSVKELDCDSTADNDLLEKCCEKGDGDSWTIYWPSTKKLSDEDLKDIHHKGGVTGVWNECSEVLEQDNLFNYYYWHYKWGRELLGDTKMNVMMIAWIPMALFLFSLIASTADMFFVRTLTKLSNVLNLTPSVSGATLIALANGAPDFFCTLAGLSGVQQTDTIIGGILGGTALITILIIGLIITVGPFQSKKRVYLRDSCFYLLALGLFGIAIHSDTIPFWVGILMFGVYGTYVLMVFFSKKLIKSMPQGVKRFFTKTDLFENRPRQRSLAMNFRTSTIDEVERVSSDSATPRVTAAKSGEDVIPKLDISSDEEMGGQGGHTQKHVELTANTNTNGTGECRISVKESDGNDDGTLTGIVSPASSYSISNGLTRSFSFWKYLTEWKEQGVIGKTISVIQAPLTFLRIISIPMLIDDEKQYLRGLLTLNMLLAPLWITYSFITSFLFPFNGFKHVPMYLICILFGVVAFLFILPPNNPPKKKGLRILILLISTVCCAAWIMIFANELLSLLGVIAGIIGMSDVGAGLTMLAMGNSAPDLMVNYAAAKEGNIQSALTASYAGAIFNILCSFGVAIASSGLGNEMAVHANSKFAFAYCLVLTGALFIFVKTIFSNYHLGKSTGIPAMVWYGVFLLFSLWGSFEFLGAPWPIRMAA